MKEEKEILQKRKINRTRLSGADNRVIALEHGKLPPQALDLEEAVLGAMMIEREAVNTVIDKLKPEHFYRESHQKIFTAIQRLFSKTEPVDILTVTNDLKANGELDIAGGPYNITQMTSRVASSANIEYHAHIIIQKFIQRELIRISSKIIEDAYEDTTDVFDLLDQAESGLFGVSEGTLRGNPDRMQDIIGEAVKDIEKAKNHKDGITGIQSGFTRLDRATSGWQKAELIILAARPGVGKTSFALSVARNVAVGYNKPTAIFSLEMSSRQLVTRLISNETELDSEKLKRGTLTMAEWEQLNAKLSGLSEAPIYIDDTPALSIFELRAKCRRLLAKHRIELVIVDYLQLMTSGEEGRGNREQEISKISRSLKSISKELDVPIIALSQLSRNLEQRTSSSKRPILSDLRESGAIEQDADMVLFIYRPEVHQLDTWEDGTDTKGQAEIIIAKNRNGATGKVRLRFIDRLAKFDDLPENITYPEFPEGNEPKTYTISSKMNEDDGEAPF